MKGKLRVIAIVVGLVLAVLIALPFLIPVNQFRPIIEDRHSDALARKVQVGALRLSLLRGSLSAENLSIADDPKFSASPFLTAKELRVRVEVLPLVLSRALKITGLTLEQPEVTLIKGASGRWNFSSIGGSSDKPVKTASAGPADSAITATVDKLQINKGRLTLATAGSKGRSVYDKVQVEATDVSFASAFPVEVSAELPGGGSFALRGRVGPPDKDDASLTPLAAKISIRGFDLASSGVIDASAGLRGKMDLDGTLASQHGEARTKGSIKLDKLLLVAGGSPSGVPAGVDFSTRYDLRRNAGVLNPSTISVGAASARLAGTYLTPADVTVVNLKFDGQNMPARDLQSFLPALGVKRPKGASLAAGALSVNLNIAGPTHRLVVTGDVGLSDAKLAGFNLGSKMPAIGSLANLKTGSDLAIQMVTTNIHMAPDGLRAENFKAVVPALGDLVGAGTVDSKNNLDFKMVATVTGGVAGALGGTVSNVVGSLLGGQKTSGSGGGMQIPFLIQGTGSDPKFLPDVGGVAAGLLKSRLGVKKSEGPGTSEQQTSDPAGVLRGLFKKKKT